MERERQGRQGKEERRSFRPVKAASRKLEGLYDKHYAKSFFMFHPSVRDLVDVELFNWFSIQKFRLVVDRTQKAPKRAFIRCHVFGSGGP